MMYTNEEVNTIIITKKFVFMKKRAMVDRGVNHQSSLLTLIVIVQHKSVLAVRA